MGWPHPDASKGLSEYYGSAGSDLLGLAGSDQTLQSLLDSQYAATDDEARTAILGQIQDYLIDQAYVVPILNDSQVYVTQQHVKGFRLTDGALPEFYNASIED